MEPRARPQGSYSHQTQVQRTASGHTRSDTWTNAEGQTATRNATGTYDPSHEDVDQGRQREPRRRRLIQSQPSRQTTPLNPRLRHVRTVFLAT